MKKEERKVLKILELFWIYIIIMVMLVIVGGFFQHKLGVAGVFYTETLLILFPVILVVRFLNLDYNLLFKFKLPKSKTVFDNFSIWMAVLIIAGAISQVQLKFFPDQLKDLERLNEFFKNTKLWQQLLIFSLTPAICEELLFRGLIFGSLKEKIDVKYAILISGILFGLFHIYPGKIVTTALLGILFAYVTYKTGSLVMPIILHFSNNSYAFLMAPQILKHEKNESLIIIIGLIMASLGINGVYQLVKDLKKYEEIE